MHLEQFVPPPIPPPVPRPDNCTLYLSQYMGQNTGKPELARKISFAILIL